MSYTEEQILQIKDRLNNASERMNLFIRQEEEYLKSLGLGVITFVGTDTSYELGYYKIDKEWRIIIREKQNAINQPEIYILDRAPRGLRYSALKYLPLLRESVIKHAESLANRIEKALDGKFEEDDKQT